MKSYLEFKKAMRMREDSGLYDRKNEYGYLGAYQFGRARLCDLGLCVRKPATTGFGNDDFLFRPPFTEKSFLGSQALQDHTFDRHVADLARRIKAACSTDNLSGSVAASHLVGFGDFLEFIRSGKLSHDANGVSVRDYFEEFRGYQIPEDT